MKNKKLKEYTKWLLHCFPTLKARCWFYNKLPIIAYEDCEPNWDNEDFDDFIDYFENVGVTFIPNWDGSHYFKPKNILLSKKGKKYHKNRIWRKENIYLKQRKH